MTTAGLSGKTAIYVSTSLKLSAEQTEDITHELLRIMGYPSRYDGFNIYFISGGDDVQANACVDGDMRVFIES